MKQRVELAEPPEGLESPPRPVLGLLVAPDPPPGAKKLVIALARWCHPHALDPRHDTPAAWLATSASVRLLGTALSGPVPAAVWVEDLEEAERVTRLAASAVLVTHRPEIALGAGAVLVPSGPDLVRATPVAPFVRARWRARYGLPERFVVSIGPDGASVSPPLVPSALAVAAAVAVHGDGARLVEALAWGAPTVTDTASAAALGATSDLHLVVAEADELVRAAEALAADERRAAALSLAGRRLVERIRGPRRAAAARALAGALRLVIDPVADGVGARLEELGTPPGARIRQRVNSAIFGS